MQTKVPDIPRGILPLLQAVFSRIEGTTHQSIPT